MKRRISPYKIILTVLAILIVSAVIVYLVFSYNSYDPNKQITYGVTFSKKFAQYLGLDWQEAYIATLDDLKVKYLRIPTYWEDIEPQKDQYDFTDIDWQLDEAAKRNAKVILVLGRRQPRWPECHDPDWAENTSKKEVREKILKNIELIVNRYKNYPAVEIWQVENEPFLDFFGHCPHMTKEELQEEIDLVRSLDNKKILITDSGELSTWYPAIKMGNLFGTTLYRTTYNKYVGYWNYFFVPASFYRVKAYIWSQPQENSFVAELQAEPWFPEGPIEMPIEEHYKSMNAKKLVKNAEYVNKTNFARAYFWGVEWWYWIKVAYNDASAWEAVRPYFE